MFTSTYCNFTLAADSSAQEAPPLPPIPAASVDIVSSHSDKDCYKVIRNLFFNDETSNPGCWTDRYEIQYYNGGLDENYEQTGFPQEIYHGVTVEIAKRKRTLAPVGG